MANSQLVFEKSQKQRTIFILIFTLVLLIVAGYLIYLYYLSPRFELYQLLPANYDISFELKTDRFTLPSLLKKQLLDNETLKEIYQEMEKDLQNLPFQAQATLKQFSHLIFFLSSPQSFGLIGEISNNKMNKQLSQLKLNDWQSQIIKKQIFITSNDKTLFKEMAKQKLTATAIPYLSLTISPWLKINVQENFFNQKYSSPTLTNLQNIILPLSLTGNNYSLEFKSGYKSLELILNPQNSKGSNDFNNLFNLSNLLIYLPPTSNFVFGLTNLDTLTANLDKNKNLRDIFQYFDSFLWLNYQISLSNLIKSINGPVLMGLDKQNWRIITSSHNKKLVEDYLRQYFGQFKPKTEKVRLPDNTFATELVNNPESVIFEEKTKDDWQYYIIANFANDLGYAVNNNLLIIGNNLLSRENQPYILNCQADDLVGIVTLMPQESLLKSSDLLKGFMAITVLETSAQQIKACFKL